MEAERSKTQVRVDLVSGEPASWFADGRLLAVSSHGGGQREEAGSFVSPKGRRVWS